MVEMSGANEKRPWKDGYWLASTYLGSSRLPGRICIVKGSDISNVSLASFVQHCPEFQATTEAPGKLIYGNFGKVDSKSLKEKTGLSESILLKKFLCVSVCHTLYLRNPLTYDREILCA